MMNKLLALAFAAALAIAPALAMTNPGVISLGDFAITSAGQQVTPQNLQQGLPGGPAPLSGLTALSCQFRFFYGGGGTKTNVYLQTSLDQGQTWFDIANVAFTTANGIETVNLSGLSAVTTPTQPQNLGLADNTTFNGPLGDRLQVVEVSTGTYTGSTLASVRCATR
jgi:hypothetical protein